MPDEKRFKVGVTIHPQQCTISELREAWLRADELGVDSIWFWDHFFPLYGDSEGNQFECWSLLAAAAIETKAPQIGPMVTAVGYRNPDLIAYMAGTIDRLSGGRFVLGIGAGWLRGVRLRFRRGQGPPSRPQRSAPAHQGSNREAQAWTARADADPHRRRRREGDAAVGG